MRKILIIFEYPYWFRLLFSIVWLLYLTAATTPLLDISLFFKHKLIPMRDAGDLANNSRSTYPCITTHYVSCMRTTGSEPTTEFLFVAISSIDDR
ncbi:hypothetical protein L211DRAFT_291187 [Terfezia boudieri ATCC MYA-4762]|uniref:Uncharacterized protein n=1 Tax=Terfezia boudieri ATCC MYA-4762 TaxID=1051890 RepID=A0A3N4LNB3_9PEZI|nr:hypothetical protein L211DRAFT_291187 [Terfezia boudieri ATCC MYA-4762]